MKRREVTILILRWSDEVRGDLRHVHDIYLTVLQSDKRPTSPDVAVQRLQSSRAYLVDGTQDDDVDAAMEKAQSGK